MTPGEQLQIDLADARRRLKEAQDPYDRKFWKRLIYEMVEEALERRGETTRTFDERFPGGKEFI